MQSRWSGERRTKTKNRVVIDTSVIVSAFAFGGIQENGEVGGPSRSRDIAVAEA